MQEKPLPGGSLVKNGKTLLSGIDPVRRAGKVCDAVSVKEKTLYFCPSPIYGWGLSRLLERLEKEAPSSAVLCVEADSELFELSQKNIDISILNNKRVHITKICDIEKIYSLICDLWGSMSFRRIEVVRFTGGYQLFPQIYDSLCEMLRRQFADDWSNALTLTKLGRLFIRNCIRNLSLVSIFPSISELSFGEDPVLVLGAGPSLDETLDALQITMKNTQRMFKIICVDTCLGALKDRGISPDLVVILESQHWNLRDFIGSADAKISAAIDISSLPASAKILNGESFLFFTPWTHLKIFERLKDARILPAAISPLGSVGLTAVHITRRLTRGKIFCAGLDFSFTADKYHARGTPGHRGKLNKKTRLLQFFNNAAFDETAIAAVSKSGENVYTNPVMKNYRALFEQEFGGDERVYDIEGTGLPLGVKTLSIDEVMEELKKENNHREHGGHGGENEETVRVRTVKPEVCGKKEKINSFYENEKKMLAELRGILTGEAEANQERLNALITECDYLWAHFPDCAGRNNDSQKKYLNEKSFLKRVRAEIDPMLKLISHII